MRRRTLLQSLLALFGLGAAKAVASLEVEPACEGVTRVLAKATCQQFKLIIESVLIKRPLPQFRGCRPRVTVMPAKVGDELLVFIDYEIDHETWTGAFSVCGALLGLDEMAQINAVADMYEALSFHRCAVFEEFGGMPHRIVVFHGRPFCLRPIR